MSRVDLHTSPSAAVRLDAARRWLSDHSPSRRLIILAPGAAAARDLIRPCVKSGAAMLGWRAVSLEVAALQLALPALAITGLAPLAPIARDAVVSGALADLARRNELGRFSPLWEAPGLAHAIGRSLGELSLARAVIDETDPDLAAVSRAVAERMTELAAVDRPAVIELALAAVNAGARSPLLRVPLLALDLAVGSRIEAELVAAIANASGDALVLAIPGDERALSRLSRALGTTAVSIDCSSARVRAPQLSPGMRLSLDSPAPATALARTQHRLFGDASEVAPLDDSIAFLSAPGEARECVEIARRIHALAAGGMRLDRIAVLLRSPAAYRAPLAEALRRADIPARMVFGVRRPDPSGRALLALLRCASEGLSARGFAEYLSLSVVPPVKPDGEPPPARTPFAPPDDYVDARSWLEPEPPDDPEPREVDDQSPVVNGTLRAPRRWERLLVDASVIGGLDRWRRRLDGLAAKLTAQRDHAAETDRPTTDRQLADLAALRAFALPLLDDLAALPVQATWGTWLEHLSALTTRAIRSPQRVLAILAELAPMAEAGPVELADVERLLAARLREVTVRPTGDRAGQVFVATIDEARGMSFSAVFVPGLAETMFPRKVGEDPIVLDRVRAALSPELTTNPDRLAAERAALHIAVGAAESTLVLSYPRVDLEQARPRVPSFYGLEILRAATGGLTGFRELADRASAETGARIAWPAPRDPALAIDDIEYDLATLERLLAAPVDAGRGAARYLLDANPHLARAMRFRARRWLRHAWTSADGLHAVSPAAHEALAPHQLDRRSFSPTALQQFAICPYRFYLYALLRLEARAAPEPVEELGPLERGSLIHEVQRRVLVELRDAGELPLSAGRLGAAAERLARVVGEVAAEFADELAPAIPRVWEDGIDEIRRDLSIWLDRMAADPQWVPRQFELAFGLTDLAERDADSRAEPVPLECGITLRGSIDLVEARGDALRATDYKTGRAYVPYGLVVAGGETLQPVLYALAIEALFPERKVEAGRLYYCTTRGGYTDVSVPLDDTARAATNKIAATIRGALEHGFFPALPRARACDYCDFRPVCGPYEQTRPAHKDRSKVQALLELRKLR